MVDDLHNYNQKLMKQIEISQVVPLFQIKKLCYHSQVYYTSHYQHVKNMYLKKYFLW
jgi:hypothetical protein